jgi:hypothetical protein
MKPRNREINIFNLSMLDVLTCALGAFLVIMLVLFPYYNKETISYEKENTQLKKEVKIKQETLSECQRKLAAAITNVKALKAQTEGAQREAEDYKSQAEKAEQEAKSCSKQLSKILIVAYISWAIPKRDIDFHIKDPAGNIYNYSHKTFAGYSGELSLDTKLGPGTEVWEIREPEPGRYEFWAHWYFKNKNNMRKPTVVNGRVIYREGRTEFKQVTLTHPGDKELMLAINVQPDGEVQIQ